MQERDGRIILVCGGTSGIGAACAKRLAPEVRHVVLASERPPAEAQALRDQIAEAGGASSVEQADVRDAAAVQAMVGRIAEAYGRIDGLVNAAGVFSQASVWDTTDDDIQKMFSVNLMGTFNVVKHVLPVMKAQGGGSIVNMASANATIGVMGTATYSASKAAVMHYTRTIAPELARTGIRINSVGPGPVRTPMTASMHSPTTPEMAEALKWVEANNTSPFGTFFSEPEDIAAIVRFLLSNEARAIHGACIVADQGLSAALPLPLP
jgi:NAD(P)-dependent dehydrogenase (short-subunit alcohol dehydrogenase family)